MSAPHSVSSRCTQLAVLALSLTLGPLALAQTPAGSQAPPPQSAPAGNSSGAPEHSRVITDAQGTKLALAAPANYKNKYEVFGGINFQNFQAGQNLPKRMNFAGAEGEFTYWIRPRLGLTGDFRFEGGTTPVFPQNYYNRVAVFQENFFGGVTYRGPKGRYGAIDYHALAGGSHGTFDQAVRNYPGGSPISATGLGLYTNHTAFMAALGGSVDFNYTRNIAIRLQPDLILERYGTELREFVAVSGGILYRFGKR